MKADYLIAEIGSTTTLVTAVKIFTKKGKAYAIALGQGKNPTTIDENDVTIGLGAALNELERNLKEPLIYKKFLAASSAAGGLRLTVHGLQYDMTVKAAKEAALGAGGNIKMVTSGKLTGSDIDKIKKISPNIIIIAGGTDYGERETALYNAEKIKNEVLDIPVIYCGNIANKEDIEYIFKGRELYITENVYPRIDELNVEPTRKIIQKVFEKNIIKAPGMAKIHDMVNGPILPTPGAVMESAKVLYDIIGDLMVIDVGGATTDVHSVTYGSSEIENILVSPEPFLKRTVEGDLGVYINSENIISLLDKNDMNGLSFSLIRNNIKPIPENETEKNISRILTKKAVNVGVNRHAGFIKKIYGSTNQYAAYGRDLSKVKYIIGTGGALTKLGGGKEILYSIIYRQNDLTMFPKEGAEILIDNDYIMAAAGVLLSVDKEASLSLLKNSLNLQVIL